MGGRNRRYLYDAQDAILGGFVNRYRENVQAVSAHNRVVHLGVQPDVGIRGLNLTHLCSELAQLGNAELIHTLEMEITRLRLCALILQCKATLEHKISSVNTQSVFVFFLYTSVHLDQRSDEEQTRIR